MDRIIIWQRHLIRESAQAQLQIMKKEVQEVNKKMGPRLELRLWLNYNPEARREVGGLRSSLGPRQVFCSPARGVGAALISPLLDPHCSVYQDHDRRLIRMVLDWDQFSVNSAPLRRAILMLASRMQKKDLLLGLGARDRIRLSRNPDLNEARHIVELFHARFIQRQSGEKIQRMSQGQTALRHVPPLYKTYGDPIPGFYAVNPADGRFEGFRRKVLKDSRRANLDRYAGDPYLVMCAATLSSIGSVCAQVRKEASEEGGYGWKTIEEIHREIGRTSIGPAYRSFVSRDSEFVEELERHYPKAMVRRVRQQIIQGLGGRGTVMPTGAPNRR